VSSLPHPDQTVCLLNLTHSVAVQVHPSLSQLTLSRAQQPLQPVWSSSWAATFCPIPIKARWELVRALTHSELVHEDRRIIRKVHLGHLQIRVLPINDTERAIPWPGELAFLSSLLLRESHKNPIPNLEFTNSSTSVILGLLVLLGSPNARNSKLSGC